MKKLYRSHTNKWLSGLCGGIGELLQIDATIIRLLFAVLAIGSFGSVLLIYIVASILVPKAPVNHFSYHNQYHY